MSKEKRLLNPHDSAVLLLLLIQRWGQEKESPVPLEKTSRVRVSELTLRNLWGRKRLSDEFLDEVREWLFKSGWALFFAGQSYGLVRTSIVDNWPRVSSKRLKGELNQVRIGEFDFESHADLIKVDEEESED
jgi:hypothetical protein